jgi:ATP-dependent Lon protease
VREKSLAALRAGITTIIVPERNLPDLEEIPKEAKRKLRFVPVATMEQVLDAALESDTPAPRRRAPRLTRTATVPAAARNPES